MLIRRGNICADAQAIFVKDHAVLVIEGEVNLLPWAEMNVPRSAFSRAVSMAARLAALASSIERMARTAS